MHLYWQRHLYAQSWQPGTDPPYSYSVYVAEGVRNKQSKRSRRRIVVYLGSVNPGRQRSGVATDTKGEWSACRVRCQFWLGAEVRIERAMTAGKLTSAQRDAMITELGEAIPPPTQEHRLANGGYHYHTWEVKCHPAPVRLPAHVQAATRRYEKGERS
jgi:hypothetical protein